LIGTQIGAYRVLQQIGRGGMGTVWLAEHTILGRRAAIKVLHPTFTARPDIVTRFFNEARAATAIADPGIVQIFDFGYHVDGSAYIAMEMLEGEPLDRRLDRLDRLPCNDALRVIRQVASTLGVVHHSGIVHRDLKPENIFLVRDPEVAGGERAKVLDFGIAKLTGDQSIKTNTSAMMGTPAYMSPEQCRGAGQVDQRSDVYALGCVLFALLTGAPPFEADGAGEVIAMHLREPPPVPSSRVADLPPEVDAVMLRCLAKDPADRYASATELAAAIGRVLGIVSSVSSPGAAPGPGSRPGDSLAATKWSSAGRAPSNRAATGARGTWTSTGSAPAPETGALKRRTLLAVIALAVVGGGAAALAVMRVGTTHAVPEATAMTAPPDPASGLAAQMTRVLTSMIAWSQSNAGAPCPTVAALGPPVLDPWGRPLEITCADQPANQIAGVISAGPDGALGTQDDIGSWQLGREVTDLVHGARWAAAAVDPARSSDPDGAAIAADVELPFEYSTEKQDWIEAAIAEFQRAHPRIHVTSISKPSLDAVSAILDGKDRPVLWSPSDSLATGLLAMDWRARKRSELYPATGRDAPQPLLLTPLVFVGWEERAKLLADAAGQLSWKTIRRAVASPRGWAEIGGKPAWGRIKVGHADPNTANSGLQALVLMAYEYFTTTSELTAEQLLDPRFREFVRELERAVPDLENSTGAFMTDMIRFGPSKYDVAVVYESVAVSQLKNAQGRWGRLHIYYPPVTIWSDHPIVLLNAPWVTADQKRAAAQLIAFLRSPRVQATALRFGFRPADTSVPILTDGAPSAFSESEPQGFSLDLPSAARPLEGPAVRAMLTTWSRISKAR